MNAKEYHLKPLLKKVGVKYKTLKATRHTFISFMKYAKEGSLKEIQETVGHSQRSEITEKHYVDPRVQKISQKQLQAQFNEQLFNSMIEAD